MTHRYEVALVGNPNCGKTTVFNALTGAKQHVGNWPGVTVERKTGTFSHEGVEIHLVDLPGVYSLTVADKSSLDEKIARDYVASREATVIVNIIDASNIERNLYLTTQLLEMGAPVIVALNMMDMVEKKGLAIDVKRLEKTLGCPVITLQANQSKGINDLKTWMTSYKTTSKKPFCIAYPKTIETAIHQYIETHHVPRFEAVGMLEGEACHDNDMDIFIADARYQFITHVMKTCVNKTCEKTSTVTKAIDRIVLNRFLGIPIFLAVMYTLFLFAINVGGAFQDFFDVASDVIFVQGSAYLLHQWHVPVSIIALVSAGLGKGINTVLTFIPVIAAMFFFLALLEQSGYMSRAAFVVDRFMRVLGLPGKSFVPMIVGFGCNVPAVLGARTLDNRRDRILTALMSPFMSCGARLAIFTVFIAAFFPEGGQNIVFALYLFGIVVAIATGFVLRKTLLQGDAAPLVMELPSYHLPGMKTLLIHTWQRLKNFIFRAGKLIVPICIILGVLNALTLQGTLDVSGGQASLLAALGHIVTPIFAPMGITADNWQATVGLITGVLAKEVVIGTLNTLYSQAVHLQAAAWVDFHLWQGLQEALMTIPANITALAHSFLHPVLSSAPNQTLSTGAMGQMVSHFAGKTGAFSYLLFILLYAPCVSTMAAISRELGRAWGWFSVLWSTAMAYTVAVIFYQVATIMLHPLSSLCWIVCLMAAWYVALIVLKYKGAAVEVLV